MKLSSGVPPQSPLTRTNGDQNSCSDFSTLIEDRRLFQYVAFRAEKSLETSGMPTLRSWPRMSLKGKSQKNPLKKFDFIAQSAPRFSSSDALDQLNLQRYCCRRMVLTHVDLIEKLLQYNREPSTIAWESSVKLTRLHYSYGEIKRQERILPAVISNDCREDTNPEHNLAAQRCTNLELWCICISGYGSCLFLIRCRYAFGSSLDDLPLLDTMEGESLLC